MLKVYSRETIVDITVVDAKGNPVHGLKQEQFTVKEDNKPQTIRSFEEFRSQPTLPLPKLPPNVYTNLQPVGASGAVDILLLDGLNTAPPDASNPDQIRYSIPIQTRVKQEAAKYLKTMPAGTRVAVLGLSRSLRILQGFSSDPNLLAAAVGTMEMNMDGRASTPAQWCAQQDMHNRMTLEALNQIAASVSPIKGKKNLIWFTAGFPTITDPSVASQAVCDSSAIAAAIAAAPRGPIGVTQQLAIPPGHGLPDYLAELRKSYGLLAAAQVAVFPIGAAGLGKLPSPTASGFVGPGTNEMAEINLSFESMAEATGGTAFYNTNDLAGAVAKAAEKGASYYTLSYVPPGKKYDNAHHTIKIAVNQPGLTLVYRTTYDAVDPATIRPAPGLTLATTRSDAAQTGQHTSPETEMRFAMGRSMPTSQQILFDVRVEPSTEPSKPTDPPIFGALDSKFTNKPLTPYAFSYAIPARQIAFTDAPDGARNGDMEFDIVAYDERGNLVNSIRQSIKLALTAEQVAQLAHSPFRFLQRLDLPSGQFFLRIGILDRTSSKIGSLEIPLLVGKDSAESKTNREMPEVKKDH
jgi:VWFA-related protein